MNRTNWPVHSELFDLIQIFFLASKRCRFEGYKTSFSKSQPLPASNPPPMRCDKLPPPTISPCKISVHLPLQDHRSLSRLFPAVPLQADKPPLVTETLVVNPLRQAVTPRPICKPPLPSLLSDVTSPPPSCKPPPPRCKALPSQTCRYSTLDTEDLI